MSLLLREIVLIIFGHRKVHTFDNTSNKIYLNKTADVDSCEICYNFAINKFYVRQYTFTYENSFRDFRATRTHRAARISVSIALSQTLAEAASPRCYCVVWNACLAPSLRRYQFILFGEQRHKCVNNLPELYVGRDSNL